MHAPIFGLMNAWFRIIILDFQEFGRASEPLASQVLTIYFHVGKISLNLSAQKIFDTTLQWNGGSNDTNNWNVVSHVKSMSAKDCLVTKFYCS